MYALFTDTDVDITLKQAKEFGYNLISMPYTDGDKEIFPYVDFEEFDDHAFYQRLREGAMPHTSGLSPETYKNYFEPFLKQGQDVLYVHFSEAMSGTFDAMKIALRDLKEQYPDRTVYTIDTKGITLGSYNIVCEIGDMYKAGKSIEEIMKWAETEVDKFAVYFFCTDLSFFKRSGRVGGFKALMGNLMGIRPIIYMGSDGKMTSIDSAKGNKGALKKMMTYVTSLADNIKDHRIVIGYADALPIAQELGELVKAEFGDDIRLSYVPVNPTAGSHCGPDTVGISFHAIHR